VFTAWNEEKPANIRRVYFELFPQREGDQELFKEILLHRAGEKRAKKGSNADR